MVETSREESSYGRPSKSTDTARASTMSSSSFEKAGARIFTVLMRIVPPYGSGFFSFGAVAFPRAGGAPP